MEKTRRWNRIGKRRDAGLTLVEMLLTVAVMTALLGVGFVAGDQMIRSSRQTSLDRQARSIYLTAGRNLESLRFARNNDLEILKNNSNLISTVDGAELYAVSSSETAAASVLLPDNGSGTDLTGGAWCISYTMKDGVGAVYEVFCTTAEYKADDAFTELQGQSMQAETAKAALRGADPAARVNAGAKVGWFGVDLHTNAEEDASVAPEESEAASPPMVGLHVLNGEELEVTLYCELPEVTVARRYYHLDGTPASTPALTLEVTGLTSGATAIIRASEASISSTKNGAYYYFAASVVLDNLSTGRFKDIAHRSDAEVSGAFQPGEDLLLTVDAVYDGVPAQRLPMGGYYTGSGQVNSLFAGCASSSDHDLVQIACGRHLQNLDAEAFDAAGSRTLHAVQTVDIDFDVSWRAIYGGRNFKPIVNTKLKSFSNESIEDGKVVPHIIMHLKKYGAWSCFSVDPEDSHVFYGE